MNAFGFRGNSFPFSFLARSSVAAHKILAVFMKAICSPGVFADADTPTKSVRHIMMALPIRLFVAMTLPLDIKMPFWSKVINVSNIAQMWL
jgi:hypothetical protein